ncbi:MAG: hypothetical protein H6Q68_833 [Firmicutes bacterium]|nr:hypothetical protein [Bacillota bacterium]
MAVAITVGLLGATISTLLVLPTMYAAWYKVQPNVTVQSNVIAHSADRCQ